MRKVTEGLFIGKVEDAVEKGYFTISLSSKYHYKLHNGKVSKESKCYLFCKDVDFVSCNMVDGQAKYFKVEVFIRLLDLIDNAQGKVLIVCDKGMSRSPSVVMLYLAKRKKVIPDTNYTLAKSNYRRIDKDYFPSIGIEIFLINNWHNIC